MTEFIGDQFVCFTKDKKFKVCSVSKDEFDELVRVFESYAVRDKAQGSLLVEWFGLYCIRFSDSSVYVYVTENPGYYGYDVVIDSCKVMRKLMEFDEIILESDKKSWLGAEIVKMTSEELVIDTKLLAKFHFLAYSLWAIPEFS